MGIRNPFRRKPIFHSNHGLERLKEEATVRQSARRILAAKNAERERQSNVEKAHELKGRGYSNVAIARELGLAESTVRRLLRESSD